jgi:glycosyltransferase involved in cell wall biosynthesis
MTTDAPRVSIGLAVYNGEKFLEKAIDSILAQTFTDFELILSDNASTDRTEEICRQYTAKDKRVRYYRNPENIGGANNENQTFRMSRGEFFRWAAHDDVCAPTLIEKCISVLDKDLSVVLCYTMLTDINEEDEQLRTISQKRGISEKAYVRFRELASRDHNCEATYGLIRSDILNKTRLEQNYTDSDRTLLCELTLYGKFYEIPEPLFFKRYHEKNMYVDWRARMAWFNPALKGKAVFPYWMQFFDYLVTIRRVSIGWFDKLMCYLYMLYWLLINGKRMVKDVFVAAYAFVTRAGIKNEKRNVYNWE